MKRVSGIGGIFFKAKDAPALQAWYKRHLGIDVQEWGGTAFTWTDGEGKPVAGTTIWSIESEQGDQFAPSTATFMVNYRVENLHALVKVLRDEGCNVLDRPPPLAEHRQHGRLGVSRTEGAPMTREVLEAQLLRLPDEERAYLARALIESLDNQPELDAVWLEEARRRAAELSVGTVQGIPATTAFGQARTRLTG